MAIGWRVNQGSGPPSGAATGDLAGTYPNPIVSGLRGVTVSPASPTIVGQVLGWGGAAWEPRSDVNYTAPDATYWDIAPPTTFATAIAALTQGDHVYGKTPSYWRQGDVTTNVTVGPPPTFAGSVSYVSSGVQTYKAGVYLAMVFTFLNVSANNTQIYWDLWLAGAPSAAGFAAFPIGVAGANDTRTASLIITLPFDSSFDLDLRFGRYAGVGSVAMRNGGFLTIRIGDIP